MQDYYLKDNPKRIYFMLAAMCFGVFSVAFNTTAVMNAIMSMSEELHLTPAALQWAVNAYLLVCATLIIIAGQLADMYGRRNLFFIGASTFAVASILIATAGGATQLIIGRGLQGLAAAVIVPSTLAVVKVGAPEHLQSHFIGVWTSTIGLGFAAGPIISGLLITYTSWRDVFWINVPIVFTSIILARLFVKKSRGDKQSVRLDLWGLLLLFLGLAPLTLGLIEGNVWGWSSVVTLCLLIGGLLVLVVFWVVENFKESPLVNFSHFKRKLFVAGNIGFATSVFCLIGILFFYNAFIQNPLAMDYSPVRAGLALMPLSLSMFLVSLFAVHITERFGFRYPLVIALLCVSLACYLLHGLTVNSSYKAMWLPLLLFGVAVGVSFPSSPTLGMNALPKEKAGEGSGIINTMNYYFGVLCIAIGTLIYIFVGRGELAKALPAGEFSKFMLTRIDRAMFGQEGSIMKLAHHLSPHGEAALLRAARLSTGSSFSAVMLMCSVVAFLGALAMFYFAKSKKYH